MNLEVLRFSSEKDSTNGLLFDTSESRSFLCYTLEDEYRENKVSAETRVPFGTYEIKYRKSGGFNSKYLKRFGKDFHKGMLQICDVPGFEYILIHIGNTDEDTAGCLLVGDSQNSNITTDNGYIGSSTEAYKRIYLHISKKLDEGERVFIRYIDLDTINY